MMTKRLTRGLALGASLAAVLALAGCAAKVPAPRPAETPPAGLVLEYKMPAGRILRYRQTEEVREISDVMGQMFESVISGTGADSFRSKGRKDGHYLLEVTIEDMSLSRTSPQGDFKL